MTDLTEGPGLRDSADEENERRGHTHLQAPPTGHDHSQILRKDSGDARAPPSMRGDKSASAINKRSEQLLRTIAREVLPQMIASHNVGAKVPPPAPPAVELNITAAEQLADLSLSQPNASVQAYVHGFEKAGYSMDAICLGLLTPAAQRLGQLWKEDRCSFLDVTVGLGKLQQVLSGIGMRSPDNGPQGTRRRALLATSSGEDHTFGVQMAAEFFRRDGWAVVRGSGGRSELAAACRRYSFDLVGLSAGTEQTIDILTRDIRAIRKASCNRFVVVMVGGALFDRHPELVPMVGADAMARNGCDAPGRARQLVALAAEA